MPINKTELTVWSISDANYSTVDLIVLRWSFIQSFCHQQIPCLDLITMVNCLWLYLWKTLLWIYDFSYLAYSHDQLKCFRVCSWLPHGSVPFILWTVGIYSSWVYDYGYSKRNNEPIGIRLFYGGTGLYWQNNNISKVDLANILVLVFYFLRQFNYYSIMTLKNRFRILSRMVSTLLID